MDSLQLQAFLDRQFPSRSKMLYANHAAISPWPRAASEAVIEFANENSERGPMAVSRWMLRESRLRRTIAGFLNATAEDIAFLQNTSEGINIIANGIEWRAGDNIVTPANEYTSNRLPWEALAGQGVEVRCVDIRATADAEAALVNAMDERSKLLTLSSVQWNDGFRLDLERLGRACYEQGIHFFVDAIQHFCTMQIDVRACHIDALSAGSHKWQMGPEGVGVFYCRPQFRKTLNLHRHGWRMFDEPYRFDRPGRKPSESARRFEAGSPNTMGQAALSGAMSVFEEVGLETVWNRISANSVRLFRGLEDIPGISLLSPAQEQRRSGIVALRSHTSSAEELRARLSRRGIFVAVRGEGLRCSPHFYQGKDQIDVLLNTIEEVK